MKRTRARILLMSLTLGASHLTAEALPRLEGPYLGQEPPGAVPRLFAPGLIVDDRSEGSSGFALGGTVFLYQKFLERRCHTYIMRLRDGQWTPPELIPFWETLVDNGDFVVSSDDKTLLYQVKTAAAGRLVSNIWRVEILPDGWGERAALPAPVNTEHDESFAAESLDKGLYFFSRRPGGLGRSDLYVSRLDRGAYSEPENLTALNTEHDEWDPFIAPDESYLIFCSTRPGGLGMDDLYLSFRGPGGGWSEAVSLGPLVNSPRSENRPYVTADGKYLFFTSSRRGNRDIYWVSTELLEKLRTHENPGTQYGFSAVRDRLTGWPGPSHPESGRRTCPRRPQQPGYRSRPCASRAPS